MAFVYRNSPAAAAGLRFGDQILQVRILQTGELAKCMRSHLNLPRLFLINSVSLLFADRRPDVGWLFHRQGDQRAQEGLSRADIVGYSRQVRPLLKLL